MIKVNLGCGNRYLSDWVNIDFVSASPAVQQHDLRKGIPCASNSVDFVYHSHVLEHFSKADGAAFVRECFRVLRPGGILRIVVPDLEQLAQLYLQMLNKASEEESMLSRANYDWSVLELIDQMVRDQPGGEMTRFWSQPTLLNEDYIESRFGNEYVSWKTRQSSPAKNAGTGKQRGGLGQLFRKILGFGSNTGVPYRDSGEIHKWMYDRLSLAVLLRETGFSTVRRMTADTSFLESWTTFLELDMEAGKIRKPDSLFMEAIK